MNYFKLNFCISFLFLLLSSNIFSQTFELPPDSLIKKLHVKTITSYLNDLSGNIEFWNVWKFDINGNLISNQLFASDDTTLCIDLYYYDGNILREYWMIGERLTHDTVVTTYFYNDEGRLIKEIHNGDNPYHSKDTNSIWYADYYYLNDSIVVKKYSGDTWSSYESGKDSMIYNSDQLIQCKFYIEADSKVIYQYNDQKQLIRKTISTISQPILTYTDDKYKYSDGQLKKEIAGNSFDGSKQKMHYVKYTYVYNKNGLIEKIIRSKTYDTYKYEFYD